MYNNTKLRGGRRHFHVILFILLAALCSAMYPSHTSRSKNLPPSTLIHSSTIDSLEYRSPQEIQIDRLYSIITDISTIDDKHERNQLACAIYTYGTQYSIDPLLLLAIARVESNFKKTVVGYGNCVGYFQINLNVHRVSKNFKNDTMEQTKKACQVIIYCRSIYGQNLNNVLNSYNGHVSQKNNYTIKVLQFYNNYKRIYKEI